MRGISHSLRTKASIRILYALQRQRFASVVEIAVVAGYAGSAVNTRLNTVERR